MSDDLQLLDQRRNALATSVRLHSTYLGARTLTPDSHTAGLQAVQADAIRECVEWLSGQPGGSDLAAGLDAHMAQTHGIPAGDPTPSTPGEWARCTPHFLKLGGRCVDQPRRPITEDEKRDPWDSGHCHWVETSD